MGGVEAIELAGLEDSGWREGKGVVIGEMDEIVAGYEGGSRLFEGDYGCRVIYYEEVQGCMTGRITIYKMMGRMM